MTYSQLYQQIVTNYEIEPQAIKYLLSYIDQLSLSELQINWHSPIKNEPQFWPYFERLKEGEPIQYILHEAHFYKSSFYVDEDVLIPRPETEQLVELAIKLAPKNGKVVDLGTGSGCVAISLKKEREDLTIWASDISNAALDVAKKNAKIHKVNLKFVLGDWLFPFIQQGLTFDVIIANPPYIASKQTVAKNVLDYEPHLALFSENGIFHHCLIINNIERVAKKNAIVLFEIDEEQKELLRDCISKQLPSANIIFEQDLEKKDRYMIIYL